jgi:hypothetical protein
MVRDGNNKRKWRGDDRQEKRETERQLKGGKWR